MKKIKHSKYRNLGIIFELLSKQVTHDILTEGKSNSLNIIKRHFKEGSDLHTELSLYQSLIEAKLKSKEAAIKLIDIVIQEHSKLIEKDVQNSKYRLIGEIRKHFELDNFFTSRIPNYKLYASIYKIFEYSQSDNPMEIANSYDVIIEHITGKQRKENLVPRNTNLLANESEYVKNLAFEMIIERFNEKYSKLNIKQKTLIKRFINENTELSGFRNYILKEVKYIKNYLNKYSSESNDKILKIKVEEILSLIENIQNAKIINDNHISGMIRSYELITVLKKLK